MKDNKTLLAWIMLISLSLIWGSSFILIKRGLEILSPGEVGALRIVSAGVFLTPFALSRLKKVEKTDWRFLLSVGFVGSLLPAFLFAIAQTQLPSSITGVLNALTPIFTILIGLFIYKVRQSRRVFAGIAIGFVGTTILIMARSTGELAINAYALLVVMATLFYGTNLNIIKNHLQHLKALTITSVSLMMVGPMAAFYLFGYTDFTYKLSHVEGAWLSASYILILGVVGTALALIIFNNLVQITTPVFTSSVTYIIPIVAVIWGLLDGEELIWLHYLGMAGIITGVYITNYRRKPKGD